MTARSTRRRQTVFVGSKIRALRKERSLTQADLAQRIGVQQSDLCRMENGEYKVALDTLFRILAVFGMEIGDFFRQDAVAAAASEGVEIELVRLFRGMDDGAKSEVLDFVRYKAARRVEAGRS